MKILYLDIMPAYALFAVQCSASDGSKTSPTADALAVYEIDGTSGAVGGTAISGSPFDPEQFDSKTGLWAVKIAKASFTAGKQYLFLWEMTVGGVTAAKQEIWTAVNAASFQADVSGLSVFDAASDSVTVGNTAACQADVSGLTSDMAALLGRLTAPRAGYLDNLNITGTLANTDNADAFRASTTGLSVFDPAVDAVMTDLTGVAMQTDIQTHEDSVLAALSGMTDGLASADQAVTILSIATEARLSKLDITGTLANTDNADAFKETCPEAVVDLSGVPADVWGYADKTVNIGSVNGVAVTGPGDFKADISGLPELVWGYSDRGITDPVSIGYVGTAPVTSPDDFKADVTAAEIDLSGIPETVWGYASRGLTAPVTVDHISDTAVSSPDDFKADVSALVPAGSRILTVQFYETGTTTPVPDVRVSIRSGGVLLFSGYSDVAGIFRMAINDGDYQVLAYQAWYVFAPVDVAVAGDTSATIYGDTQAESVPAPDHASDCRVSVPLASYSGSGRLTEDDISNAYARIKVLPLNVGGRYYSGQQIPASWDDSRQEIYWEIVQGATVYINVPLHDLRKEVVLPESAFYEVGED